MEHSVFLARLLGLYCIVIAVGVLLNLKTYQKVMEDFIKNTALLYIGGVLALLFGLAVVLFHNIWIASWPVLITIFGWIGVIKGILIIVLPNTLIRLTQAYQKKTALLVIQLIFVLAIGITLTIFGYSFV